MVLSLCFFLFSGASSAHAQKPAQVMNPDKMTLTQKQKRLQDAFAYPPSKTPISAPVAALLNLLPLPGLGSLIQGERVMGTVLLLNGVFGYASLGLFLAFPSNPVFLLVAASTGVVAVIFGILAPLTYRMRRDLYKNHLQIGSKPTSQTSSVSYRENRTRQGGKAGGQTFQKLLAVEFQ
jgi:hypothetical protein